MQSKIKNEHLSRKAYIYIRQSTMDQVYNNIESQRLQYKLVDRAQELGWLSPVIVDDDLGRSASGTIYRPGFQRLLSAIEAQNVGAIFCIEASRLARNNREWYQLIDHCAIVNALLIDLDGIYNPCNVSDRVFLGMKGTMSEYELGIFHQRAQTAILAKAQRGEYFNNLPAGYIKVAKNRYDIDPNQRVQEALKLVFQKFKELGSATQLVRYFHSEKLEIPCSINNRIIWKLPTISTISKILKNPIYAGAYVYGKSRKQTDFTDGHPHKTTAKYIAIEDWKVLIKHHHQAYISWNEYQANRTQLEQNTSKRGHLMKGAVKKGQALLTSLLRCAKCSQKLYTRYSAPKSSAPRYLCRGQASTGEVENCLSFHGAQLEKLVSTEILRVVEPASIGAAEQAEKLSSKQYHDKKQSIINALKQAEYEANRCFEQFNSVDPKNRLVAQNLENNWNVSLAKVEKLSTQLEEINRENQPLSEQQRKKLSQLASDLPKIWNHPKADAKLKKRIVQTLIHEIIVDVDEDNVLKVVIHWIGGKHTEYLLKRRKIGHRESKLYHDTEKIIRELAEIVTDQQIARILNLLKYTTASGKTWTANRVKTFRNRHHIASFKEAEFHKKGVVNLQQAAQMLKTHPETISRLIKSNIIKARQIVKYSPWIIDKEQLKDLIVLNAVSALEKGEKIMSTKDQIRLEL